VAVSFIPGALGFIVGPGLPAPGLPPLKGHGATIVKLGFLAGGVAFLLGSYPMLPELFTQLRTRGCA
jgi:hypothetical protein